MSLVVANRNKSIISNCSLVSHVTVFFFFFLKPNQQALERKDSNVQNGSIGGRNNGIISSNNSQCLINLALMHHSFFVDVYGVWSGRTCLSVDWFVACRTLILSYTAVQRFIVKHFAVIFQIVTT